MTYSRIRLNSATKKESHYLRTHIYQFSPSKTLSRDRKDWPNTLGLLYLLSYILPKSYQVKLT